MSTRFSDVLARLPARSRPASAPEVRSRLTLAPNPHLSVKTTPALRDPAPPSGEDSGLQHTDTPSASSPASTPGTIPGIPALDGLPGNMRPASPPENSPRRASPYFAPGHTPESSPEGMPEGFLPLPPESTDLPGEKKKKEKKGKKKDKKRKEAALLVDTETLANGNGILGSKRGVETMFRNVFRSELDLITLAATKANIMISLNGLIVSALMISGAFIHAASPQFFVPVGIFMVTAAASIVFALLAASPERSTLPHAFWQWLKDVFRRKARLRDFNKRVVHQKEHFVADEANILIFKDRVKLSREDYLDRMFETINSRQLIYTKMSEQLYWLGLMANQKFKYLNMSYSIFRWGLLASAVAFIGIRFVPGAAQGDGNGSNGSTAAEGFNLSAISALFGGSSQIPQQFQGTYEPSSVLQLDDGRILIVEDESRRSLGLLTAGSNGKLTENEDIDTGLVQSVGRKLNDMEALTRDKAGNIYSITSHSTNRQGERNPNREVLMRFRIAGDKVADPLTHTKLVDQLTASGPLQTMIEARTGSRADFRKTNIEGMSYDQEKGHLLLGFREPVVNGKTMILAIGNPDAMFTQKAAPQFVDAYFLDMKGNGIRGMSWDAAQKRYLLTNEIRNAAGKNRSHLWSWNGNADSAPVDITPPAFKEMKNVEGVGTVRMNDKPGYLFTSDEGDAALGTKGQYLWLAEEDLKP
ncbi:MAG: DUF3616 domain-containing protein [Lautropia sp.]|nr:DUF3616 domain-containing protein [Lautropia sp.]